MKTKTNAQRSTLNAQRSTAEKRSLAAHKANWTRQARRKAGRPAAGQELASATTAAIETELITRAIERTGRGIAAMEVALGHMRAKQLARVRALEKIVFAPSALKTPKVGGAK